MSNGGTTLAEIWPADGRCSLCRAEGPLCRSHIIPKFVGDWLRKTNVTGRFRRADAPNKLVEDLEWRHMLCSECEARLSPFETLASERIFLPLQDRQQDRFRYGPWFTKFAVSVVWRVLAKGRRENLLEGLAEVPQHVDGAEKAWSEFLVGQRDTPAPYNVHAVALDVPVDLDVTGLSPHLHRFLLRSVVHATRNANGSAYVFAKMARLLIVGTIDAGPERGRWKGSKLHAKGGSWGGEDYHLPAWLWKSMNDGAEIVRASAGALSPRQQQQTRDLILDIAATDPQRITSSDNWKAFEHDAHAFGESAFAAEPTPDLSGKTEDDS